MDKHRSAFPALGIALVAAASLLSPPAHAAPAHEALVIGNGTYNTLPAIPACLLSAHAVSAALHAAGFDVVAREDATSGATDAAIGEVARTLSAAPGATAFVYVCAYATAFNDRAFLLPTSANITRPTDVLSQGVLVRSLIETLTRNGVQSAVVALDVVPAPDAPAVLGLDGTLQGNLPGGLGTIAVSQAAPQGGPTPLAASLVASLKGPAVPAGSLLAAVRQQLESNKALTIAAIRMPVGDAYLVGAAPSPTPPPSPPSPPAAPPAPAQPAATPPPAAVAALPDEAQMTDADRRRVQTALVRLGYYDGRVDGMFGPDTRAAIRRYQHELHQEMTGRLTAEQANKLANGT